MTTASWLTLLRKGEQVEVNVNCVFAQLMAGQQQVMDFEKISLQIDLIQRLMEINNFILICSSA